MTIFHISPIHITCEYLWWIDYLSLIGIQNAHTVATLFLLLFKPKCQLEYHGAINKRFAYPFQALCRRLSTIRGHFIHLVITLHSPCLGTRGRFYDSSLKFTYFGTSTFINDCNSFHHFNNTIWFVLFYVFS